MVRQLRHRQTKGTATVETDLTPPRHISTLQRSLELRDDKMTKAYSLAFKQKMVERLTGKHAVNPSQLGREIGIRQQNLSRWLHEARSLPPVASNTPKARIWTVE